MALKRCVTIRAPAAKAAAASAAVGVAVPEAHDRPGRRQRRDLRRRRRWPAPPSRSAPAAARAASRRAARGPPPASAGSAAGRARPCAAGRGAALRGAARGTPAPRPPPPRPPPRSPRRVTSGVSVISVGSSAVVPSRACAAQIVRMPSRSGLPFSITPPPPFTCRSTNPGASTPPSSRTRAPAGASSARHDRRHPPVLDDERRVGMQPRPVEDRGADEDRHRSRSPPSASRDGVKAAKRPRASAASALTPARLAAPPWTRRLDEAAASSSASQAILPFLAAPRPPQPQHAAGRRGACRRHARAVDAPPPGHTVSVTLRRWGGVSGLNPRRRASASMKR